MPEIILILSISGAAIGAGVGVWAARLEGVESPFTAGFIVLFFVAIGFLFGTLATPAALMAVVFWLIGKLATIGVKA